MWSSLALVTSVRNSLEVGGQRQVEHGVDGVLAHLLADLGEGQTDVLFQLGLGLEVLDHDLLD